jgi:cytidylate kinase
MPHFAFHPPEDVDSSGQAGGESPRHGFQGDRAASEETAFVPAAVTIAVSREAGSRGGSIARRAAAKLGWQVYSQELLEYIAQDGNFRNGVEEQLSPAAVHWVEEHLEQLRTGSASARTPEWLDLARMVLALAAQGGVVLIGRGAGFLLPPRSTLHVRVIAPLSDRIAYMSQWLRLTPEEAAEQVRVRDSRRAEFIATHFQRRPGEVHQYDLLLNSSLLGEELCAGLIVSAAQAKDAALTTKL